jgi:hypothetical protein
VTFTRAEEAPLRIGSNTSSSITGWIIVKDHPYVAVSNERGEFEIGYVPLGDWEVRVWHEEKGWLVKGKLGSELVPGKGDLLRIRVHPGENDLGTLKINGAETQRGE